MCNRPRTIPRSAWSSSARAAIPRWPRSIGGLTAAYPSFRRVGQEEVERQDGAANNLNLSSGVRAISARLCFMAETSGEERPVGRTVDDERLHAQAAVFVKEHRLPGAAVGVMVGDELAWSVGVGFADLASGRHPDANTLFRIASITKTFTGTAVMQLCAAGRLSLDDPAVEYLPELSRPRASPAPSQP